jgi:hypothetical protein
MKVWKKAVMVYFMIQSHNLPVDFEGYHEETQLTFKLTTFLCKCKPLPQHYHPWFEYGWA